MDCLPGQGIPDSRSFPQLALTFSSFSTCCFAVANCLSTSSKAASQPLFNLCLTLFLTWLDTWINLVSVNWNSEQIRDDAQRRKQELHLRLAQIPEEKKKLDDEIQAMKRELIGLDQVLEGLEVMTSGPVPTPEPAGFTDKIRKLLSETSVPLVPTQIRDELEKSGVTGASPKNLLISVHTVLERIDDELEKVARASDGKIAYKRKVRWGTGLSKGKT